MKKYFFVMLMSVLLAPSCKKNEVIPPKEKMEAPSFTGQLVYWDDLPDAYKNAIPVAPDEKENENKISARNSYEEDIIFARVGRGAGISFALQLPSTIYTIHRIGIGIKTSGAVAYITIWYGSPTGNGLLYVMSSGGDMSAPMATHTFSAGEYINSYSAYSVGGGFLRNLAIYTNKGVTIGGGSSSSGTYSRYFVTPGSYIGKFSGIVANGSAINSISATSYFKPWQKVSSSNAKDIAVDTSGTAFITNGAGTMYQMARTETTWSRVSGAPAGVTKVAANIGIVCALTNTGTIYRRYYNQWSVLPGNDAKDIAVNAQGTVFKVSNAGKLYSLAANATWILQASGNLQSIAAGNQSNIRMVGTDGRMFSLGVGLVQMPGSNGSDIAIAVESDLWITTTSGKINVMRLPNMTWKEVAGSSAVRIDAIPGKVMMVNSIGDVYKMDY